MNTKYKIILVKCTEEESPEKLMMMRYPDREDRLFEGEINSDEMVEILSHAFNLVKNRKELNK